MILHTSIQWGAVSTDLQRFYNSAYKHEEEVLLRQLPVNNLDTEIDVDNKLYLVEIYY